jgi:hypothetical protein
VKKPAKPKLKTKTQVKGGGSPSYGINLNHNERALKKPAKPKLKVKTQVKGGGDNKGVQLNHNESTC